MSWRLGILAALGALLWLSSPAAAGIQRFVDSRGVVHIRNTGPGTSPNLADSPAEAASPAQPQPEPPTAPSPSPTDLSPQAQAGAPSENPAPQVAPNRAAPQAAQKASRGTPPEANEPGDRPLLQRVSYPVAAPSPVNLKEAGRDLGPEDAEEGIRRFRDRRGVLHITNATSQTEAAEAGLEAGGSPPGSRSLVPEQTAEPPLRKVSWTKPSPDSTITSAGLVPPGPDPAPGAIRRYRDPQGVLHIENALPTGREARSTAILARPGKVPKHIEIFGKDGVPLLPLEKAAWPAEVGPRGPPAARPREIAAPQVDVLAEGSIRRYRDGKGVLHIETVEYPRPQLLPGPMLLVRPEIGRFAHSPYAGPGPPAAGSGVIAQRDRKGRLTIRNQEPPLQVAQGPPQPQGAAQLDPILQEASLLYGLPVALIQALIKVESNFASWAVSPKGAMGLMQLMPGTANFLGVNDAFNPRQNILAGCRYLRLLLDLFGGSLLLALAAYNAGYQRVVSCGFQVPPIKETQEFVTQVLGRYYTTGKGGRSPRV
jgi:hypothetical protein